MIYVIDDDESVRRAVRRLILAAGWDVEAFASAEEFPWAAAQQAAPSCLVLDVHLPGLSGPELYEKLLAAEMCVPVVFITAHDDTATRVRVLRTGAITLLEKPFAEQALLDAVARAVGL